MSAVISLAQNQSWTDVSQEGPLARFCTFLGSCPAATSLHLAVARSWQEITWGVTIGGWSLASTSVLPPGEELPLWPERSRQWLQSHGQRADSSFAGCAPLKQQEASPFSPCCTQDGVRAHCPEGLAGKTACQLLMWIRRVADRAIILQCRKSNLFFSKQDKR